MKTIVIISVYPSNDKIINILNRCIHLYKSIGLDVMVVSHLPLDVNTAKNATYTIYDSNNTFLKSEYCPKFYSECSGVKVTIPTGGHCLPICRSMNLSINLSKILGYENFIFTEADVLLVNQDLEKLISFINQMVNENKKMLFFKPKEYRCINGSEVYETLLFGGNVNYFLNTFQPPLSVEEWLNLPMGYTLELSFYEKFSKDESNFLIVNDHSSIIFNNSDVNILRYGFFNCEMIYNLPDPSKVMLFIMNYSLKEDNVKYITVYKNNVLFNKINLYQHSYWFIDFEIDNSTIIVEIYIDENKTILEESKKFILNQELLTNSKEKGLFEFN